MSAIFLFLALLVEPKVEKAEILLPEARNARLQKPGGPPRFVLNLGPAGEVFTPGGPVLRTDAEIAAAIKQAADDARRKAKNKRIRVQFLLRADGKVRSERALFVTWTAAKAGFVNLQARVRNPLGIEGALPLLTAAAPPVGARAVVVRTGPKGTRYTLQTGKREIAVARAVDLPAALKKLRREGESVYLVADGRLPWTEVANTFDACLDAGFEYVVLVPIPRKA